MATSGFGRSGFSIPKLDVNVKMQKKLASMTAEQKAAAEAKKVEEAKKAEEARKAKETRKAEEALLNYSVHYKTAYPLQGDIDNTGKRVLFPIPEKMDIDSCKKKCNSIANCDGFSTDGQYCWFKKNDELISPINVSNLDYYYKPETKNPPPRSTGKYNVNKNTDYPNQGDIIFENGNIDRCKKRCDEIKGCVGFVTDNNNNCWFKNDKAIAKEFTYENPKDFYYAIDDVTGKTEPLPAIRIYENYPMTDYPNQGNISQMKPNKGETASNIIECQNTCDNLKDCYGFAFDGELCEFKNLNVQNPEYTFRKPKMYFYSTNEKRVNAPPGPAERKYTKYQNTNYPRADIKQVNFKPTQSNTLQEVKTYNNFCIDVPGGNTNNGTQLAIWNCVGNDNQMFMYDTNTKQIKHRSGKCLDVDGAGKGNGTKVHLWDCHDGNNQKWDRVGNTFKDVNSGKCLDISGGKFENGTKLQIWDCHAGTAQNFTLSRNDIELRQTCQKECNTTEKCTGFVTNRRDFCWLKGADVGEPEFNSELDYYYTGYTPEGPAYEGYYQCVKNNVRQDNWNDDGQNGGLRNWKRSDATNKCNEQDYPAWAFGGNVAKVGNCYGDCKAVPVSESPVGVIMIQNLGNNGCLDSGGQGPSYINNNCQPANNFRYYKSQPWRVGASVLKSGEGNLHQYWKHNMLGQLVNIQNGYCLESDGRLRDCSIRDVNNNQVWVLAKDKTLRNLSDTNKCFNGSNLVECDSEDKSQKWKYLANQGTKQQFDYQLFSGRSIRR